MNHSLSIAKSLNVKSTQVDAVINLLDEANTIPFIARYRKEATGNLDEEQIRQISDQIEHFRSLDKRRKTILTSIEEQGKLTPELQGKIEAAESITALEDIYQPYKPKRKTRASVAKEKGLLRLGISILRQGRTGRTAEQMAEPFLNEQVTSIEDALAGARDIVAETICDHAEVRQKTREKALKWGTLVCEKSTKAEDDRKVYETYYDFSIRVEHIRPHQVLAINRGEKDKVLRVRIDVEERDWFGIIAQYFYPDPQSSLYEQLKMAIMDAAERLLLPAIERDVRRILTEQAEEHAIGVFATNLKALLNQPPLAGYIVMGIDPGFRTGSKVTVVDPTGKLLDMVTIYPHEPQKRWSEALNTLGKLIKDYQVNLIAIGNGTASRETEQLVAELLKDFREVHYMIASEAGASVYSASPLARAELPDLDVSMRGAVSIARRVQDPLSELVKIDPKSIGVGMYQHDVNESSLGHSLNGVVESVVNNVGVDLNSSSPALLTHVSGIGPKLAESIVAHRDANGKFRSRQQLREVSGLGPKAYEQCAGFLRIREGENPLDASSIHPESYKVAEKVLKLSGLKMEMPPETRQRNLETLLKTKEVKKLAEELKTGEHTLQDIFEQLVRPGRDPREDLPRPILRSDVLSMKDLVPGMKLNGTVRNVVDFGVFIDIGVKQDGLLHRSQIKPGTGLQVGDVIQVEILKIEEDRGRIALTM